MSPRAPVYARLLRLRHVRLRAWHGVLLGEGAVVVAVLLVLADLASAWTLLVLPVLVAGATKTHDLVAGLLADDTAPRERDGAAPAGTAPVGQREG